MLHYRLSSLNRISNLKYVHYKKKVSKIIYV